MKVVTSKMMAQIEALAYQEGCSEEEFMEKAGHGIAQAVNQFTYQKSLPKNILLLCGKGNNGGDAFVAGRYLLNWGFEVTAVRLDPPESCSELCQKNGKRFQKEGGSIVKKAVKDYSHYSIILDGLFGTGFKGEVKEPYSALIQSANESKLPIIAIDIPSGLNGSTGEASENVIHATITTFLGLPKTGFFLQNGWNNVGKLRHVDFGLPQHLIEKTESGLELLTEEEMAYLVPSIKRNRYKYQAGQVVGLAGSPGMPGASMISSLAALRGGCGVMRLLFPTGMEAELAASPYELIKVSYSYDKPEEVLQVMQKGNATFVGPGLGLDDKVRKLLKDVLPKLEKPFVVDADALTLYSEGAFEIPKNCNCVFTPHTGEMQRLLHSTASLTLNDETLQICQKYAEDKNITLILKGAPTLIFHPNKPILVNPTGDPGMATAGSGDVLTGLIASLLAQGLACREAAAFGVYLHGLAGEYAAVDRTSHSMIATDLIDYFNDAYKQLLG